MPGKMALSGTGPGGPNPMNLNLTQPLEEEQGIADEEVASASLALPILNPLLWVVLCTGASAYQDLRTEWGGLYFHPYLLVSFTLVFRAVRRLHAFPSRIARPAILFLGMIAFVLIRDRNAAFYLLKMAAIIVTFVLIALSVRSREDFFAGAFGLGLCVTILSIKGMMQGIGNYGSINPIEGTQKNAFSLYYLPAFTICLQVLQWPDLPLRRRLILGAMLVTISGAILLSTNRSGWLAGAFAVILVFSATKERVRIFLVLLVLTGFAFLIASIIRSNTSEIIERDAYNTEQSDILRWNLFTTALSQLQANPFFGVTPTRLRGALRMVPGVDSDAIDVHNLTGFLLGGFGVTTFLAFCLFCYAIIWPPPNLPRRCGPRDQRLLSYRLLRNVFLVWLLRAQFQEDALFSPPFCVSIALCAGLCISQGLYTKSRPNEIVAMDSPGYQS